MARKPNSAPQLSSNGIGLDPEAEATARAQAESPEGEVLYQEIKRLEARAAEALDASGAVLDPVALTDDGVELTDPGPAPVLATTPPATAGPPAAADDEDEASWEADEDL